MNTITILFIVTSHSMMGNTGKPTGVWMEELTTPYYEFVDAGYDVDIASIQGGVIPVDPRSKKDIGKNPQSVDRFLQDEKAMKAIQSTLPINEIDATPYLAVFLPGGHGTMFDLPDNEPLSKIISATLDDRRIVAAVCHGPAGLVSATFTDGTPVVKDKRVTAFTNAEEEAAGLTNEMPFLLETRLRDLGANVVTVPNFEPHAIADENLITGQNPASSKAVADLVIHALSATEKE